MSFGRKRNMSERWLRKNTPGTGKRGRLTDQGGLGRTTTAKADFTKTVSFLELKKILKPKENEENERPVLEPISEETIRRDFGRSTGLADRTNQRANRPANQKAEKSKPVRQTSFNYGFN